MRTTIAASAPRRLAGLLVAAGLLLVVLGIATISAAPGSGAQTTTTAEVASTITVTTSSNLVEGSVSSAATTTTVAVQANKPDTSGKATRTTNWKVWGIVGGLVLVAILMALLTWRYWRKTRPQAAGAAQRGAAFTVPDVAGTYGTAASPDSAEHAHGVEPASVTIPDATAEAPAPRQTKGRRRSSRYADLEISLPPHGLEDPPADP